MSTTHGRSLPHESTEDVGPNRRELAVEPSEPERVFRAGVVNAEGDDDAVLADMDAVDEERHHLHLAAQDHLLATRPARDAARAA